MTDKDFTQARDYAPHPASASAAAPSHTPWRTHMTDETLVVDADGEEIATICGDYETEWTVMADRAALIVKAANSHQQMKDALWVVRLSAVYGGLSDEAKALIEAALTATEA